jgi:hypothetical protein
LIGVIIAAVSSVAAVIAIPELHDTIFRPAPNDLRSAPPKEPALPSRNPFLAVTGVDLNASIEDVKDRIPNIREDRNSGYRYSRRINTKDGSSMDLDIVLNFEAEKVNRAYVILYADLYSGTPHEAPCVERHSVAQLVDWYKDVWGAPVCFRQSNELNMDDRNIYDVFFEMDNIRAYFQIRSLPDNLSSHPQRRCVVQGWLNDHEETITDHLLSKCLKQNH